MAERLGTPLMPWQRYVADVALEVDPESGMLVHREVNLTVPRQSGKTTLLLPLMVARALLMGSRQRIVYTAQTRNDARKKWEDEHLEALRDSEFGRRKLYKPTLVNGREQIKWLNGSTHGLMATTKKSGHGPTIDLAVVDEAFAQKDFRLEQACKPSMITRPQPQMWNVSTAGDEESLYFWSKVQAGRRRVEANVRRPGVAYFEWSAEEGADPLDPATWWTCMPALGITVTEAAVQADADSMLLDEFSRAYCNLWPEGMEDVGLFDLEAWSQPPILLAEPADLTDPVVFGFDVHQSRKFAAIGAACSAGAGADGDRLDRVELVDHRAGTSWLVDRIAELDRRYRPDAWMCDHRGPAGSLIPDLEDRGITVTPMTSSEQALACGLFFDGIENRTLRHITQEPLDEALAGAAKRELGGGPWLLDRRNSDADICPANAVIAALWGHRQHRPGRPIPGMAGGDVDDDELDRIVAEIEEEEARALEALGG